MANPAPTVLLLDDGELDDVKAMLEELGADYAHLRGGAIPSRVEPPSSLFICTSRRAMVAKEWSFSGTGPIKLVLVSEDSNTLRNMLRRIGFEYLVRRPVHPVALRLLLTRALYQGEERRKEDRVAVGCEISYRSGFRRRSAILADISSRGCRLLLEKPLAVGARVTLQFGKELTGGKALHQRAVVVRAIESATRVGHGVGLAFEGLNGSAREAIQRIIKARATGPATLSREVAKTVEKKRPKPEVRTPQAGPSSDVNRRKHQRAAFEREVVMLDDEASRVLVGRDISRGGMRVDAAPGIEEGRLLSLAIYGAAREEPFIVKARVLRREGEAAALVFEQITTQAAERLDAMVGDLPSVESLEDGELGSVGTVVSQILEGENEIEPES